jgi:RNA polymerase sigma-70 factor (ECF subfamily)
MTTDKGAELFQEVFKTYGPVLYNFCLTLTRDPNDAEDAAQDIFMRLWEHRGELGEVRDMETWVKTVARNHVYDMFRRRLVASRHSDRIRESFRGHISPCDEIEANDLRERIAAGTMKLSERQREIILLRGKEFRNDEIAELLGISKRTVEAHIREAYRSLRGDLGDIEALMPAIVLAIQLL